MRYRCLCCNRPLVWYDIMVFTDGGICLNCARATMGRKPIQMQLPLEWKD